MKRQTDTQKIKTDILKRYYEESYSKALFLGDVIGTAISYFEKQVEAIWEIASRRFGTIELVDHPTVLEIGGGQGEHLKWIKYRPTKYVSLDITAPLTIARDNARNTNFSESIEFVLGDAHDLPFEDNSFDRTFGTCILHHVLDPMRVFFEAKKVTKDGGEIAFVLPTDPGITNRKSKQLFTFRKIRKHSGYNPELLYAFEHPNSIHNLVAIFNFVFQDYRRMVVFKPFPIFKWNLNFCAVFYVRKSPVLSNDGVKGKVSLI